MKPTMTLLGEDYSYGAILLLLFRGERGGVHAGEF
jgi:hypothetical protein